MGSRKRARLAERRAAVTPMRLAIVTAPSSSSDGVSLARDVELVKASVLYADEIELVSIGAVMLAGMAEWAGSDNAAMTLISSLDDQTLGMLSGGSMPDNWRETLALLSHPAVAGMPEVAPILAQWREMTQQSQAEIARVAEEQLVASGAEELLPAISTGLVTLSHAGFSDGQGDTDALMENWLLLLKRLLVDPKTRLVLDDEVGSLAGAMIREGHVDPSRLALRHAGEAAVGSGLIARLPAFPQAPLDEILDLRDDLARPLIRYRAAVVRLSDRLTAGPFEPDLADEIHDLWAADVQPALADIDDGLHEHGLVKEIARAARDDVKELVGGGAALYVGFAGLASMNDWIAATAGVAAAAVGAAAKGHAGHAREQQALKRQDLFYLYELNRRLG